MSSSQQDAKFGHSKQPRTRSAKAGIVFPVARAHRFLRDTRYSTLIRYDASVYFAAVTEYLVAEILELAGIAAHNNQRKGIRPHHIELAIRNDEELDKLLRKVILPQGGVCPYIHESLLPKRKQVKVVSDDAQNKLKV